MSLTLTSSAFNAGTAIPARYTCDDADVTPPLTIAGVPPGAKSLALIMDDPDAPAGTWDHWLLYNLPPDTAGLAEDLRALPQGARLGKNSWGRTAWGGPCPPRGSHRYFFRLYALDQNLSLPEGATKRQILAAIDGHVLAQAELMGTYTRR